MAQYAAFVMASELENQITETMTTAPLWVREDNIAVYDLNIPNRVVRQNSTTWIDGQFSIHSSYSRVD
jgi:hypothetical protein